MPLNPVKTTAAPQRTLNPRSSNRTGCLEFNPADGPRFLHARHRDDGDVALLSRGLHRPERARVPAITEPHPPADASEVSDEVLVERCKAELPHNLEAYEELVRRHETRVLNACTKMIGNRFDAEEICQDAFIQVFRKIHQFEGRSSFKTWLFRITYNMCLTRRRTLARRKDREAKISEEVNALECANLADAGIGDLCDTIQEALGRLDDQKRRIVALKFVCGLSHEEIAAQLNLKLSAAKMRCYRALDEFKTAYLDITGNNLAA